jgi:hypothetical protein
LTIPSGTDLEPQRDLARAGLVGVAIAKAAPDLRRPLRQGGGEIWLGGISRSTRRVPVSRPVPARRRGLFGGRRRLDRRRGDNRRYRRRIGCDRRGNIASARSRRSRFGHHQHRAGVRARARLERLGVRRPMQERVGAAADQQNREHGAGGDQSAARAGPLDQPGESSACSTLRVAAVCSFCRSARAGVVSASAGSVCQISRFGPNWVSIHSASAADEISSL